jgi:hypothetical protein
VHQIAGMAKALELSYDNLEEEGSDFWIEKRRIDLPLVFLNLSWMVAKMGFTICWMFYCLFRGENSYDFI